MQKIFGPTKASFAAGFRARRERLQRALQLQTAALQLPDAGAAIGLTYRQFERVFGATFGIRPKLFQRISRVEAALRDALAGGRTDADIALKHGYFDQSHFGKDLRALAGAPLRNLLAEIRSPDSAYWPLAIGAAYPAAALRRGLPTARNPSGDRVAFFLFAAARQP